MARRKFNLEKLPHERIPKKTSQGNRKSKMKFSSMNKHRKRSFKAYNRQGK